MAPIWARVPWLTMWPQALLYAFPLLSAPPVPGAVQAQVWVAQDDLGRPLLANAGLVL